jgi:hypothetical protein
MLQVNLPSETYATYNAQVQAQQQAALIRQRQQELATLQALQMQLQAQQQALLSNFPGGLSALVGNIGGAPGGLILGNQNQMHHQMQQQNFGGGGSGPGIQLNFPLSPGTIAALGSMNNLNSMNTNMPSGSYQQSLHHIPSNSSLPQMAPQAPSVTQQQQYNNQQQQYSQGPGQQQLLQQQQQQPYQQQQPGHTLALPIVPLSTPAQMPSMPSAAALMAEHNQQQQQRQQQHQYLNQMQQQLQPQQQYNLQQYNPNANMLPMGAGAGGGDNNMNMNNPSNGGGNDGGNIYHQGSLQNPQQGGPVGDGAIQTIASGRPNTAGTDGSPTMAGVVAADGGGDEGGRVKRRTKSSPSLEEKEKEKRPMNEYNAYMQYVFYLILFMFIYRFDSRLPPLILLFDPIFFFIFAGKKSSALKLKIQACIIARLLLKRRRK